MSWLILYLAEIALNIDLINGIRALFWQMLTGHAFHVNAPLWFMAVSIWLTLLYCFIFTIPNKTISFWIIHLLLVLALLAQYTGLNYKIFAPLPFETK